MDKLPTEIMDLIASYCSRLSDLAVTSRHWQHVVESRTMARLRLWRGCANSVENFARVLSVPRRRRLLRELEYIITLPGPSNEKLVVFREGIIQLFSCLQRWGKEASIRLEVVHHLDPLSFPCDVPRYMTLADDNGSKTTLPVVQAVTSLVLIRGTSIHPITLGTMARALPRLEEISFAFNWPSQRRPRYRNLRRRIRDSFATVFFDTPFQHLTSFKMLCHDKESHNHNVSPTNFVDGQSGRDRLGLALRRISQLPSLRYFEIKGGAVLGPDLFCIDDNSSWPSLRTMVVEANAAAPDGTWYLTGTPEGGEDPDFNSEHSENSDYSVESIGEEDEWPALCWRERPDPTSFDPFILSIARVVPAMPALQLLEVSLSAMSRRHFRMEFLAPGTAARRAWHPTVEIEEFDRRHLRDGRWEVREWDSWEATEEIKAAWKESADHLIMNERRIVDL